MADSFQDATALAQRLSGAAVLITGATGFLGTHLLAALHAGGVRPSVLVREPDRAPHGTQAVIGDLADPASLATALAACAPEIIFHLGARTEPLRDRSLNDTMLRVNLGGTLALAEAALEVGTRVFITTGTAEEYGHQTPPFREDMSLQPLSPYSASKAAATQWLQMMHRAHGLPAVILRPFLIYGPGQVPPKLIPSVCAAALAGADFPMTSGQQRRELTYVDDVVVGLLRAAHAQRAIGEVINLGHGTERPILDFVTRVYALAGQGGAPQPGALPDRPGDMQRYSADTSKAADLLGWRATTPLDRGLQATMDWMAREAAR